MVVLWWDFKLKRVFPGYRDLKNSKTARLWDPSLDSEKVFVAIHKYSVVFWVKSWEFSAVEKFILYSVDVDFPVTIWFHWSPVDWVR